LNYGLAMPEILSIMPIYKHSSSYYNLFNKVIDKYGIQIGHPRDEDVLRIHGAAGLWSMD
jgi:hypothetical protein